MSIEQWPSPEMSSKENGKDVIDRIEDAFDKAADFAETSADKGMDFIERIGDKIADSYLMNRLMIRQERQGILKGFEHLITDLSDDELMGWHKDHQEMTAAIQKEIEIGKNHSTGDETQDQRFIKEKEACAEGNQKDLDLLKAEIDRRKLSNPN